MSNSPFDTFLMKVKQKLMPIICLYCIHFEGKCQEKTDKEVFSIGSTGTSIDLGITNSCETINSGELIELLSQYHDMFGIDLHQMSRSLVSMFCCYSEIGRA